MFASCVRRCRAGAACLTACGLFPGPPVRPVETLLSDSMHAAATVQVTDPFVCPEAVETMCHQLSLMLRVRPASGSASVPGLGGWGRATRLEWLLGVVRVRGHASFVVWFARPPSRRKNTSLAGQVHDGVLYRAGIEVASASCHLEPPSKGFQEALCSQCQVCFVDCSLCFRRRQFY